MELEHVLFFFHLIGVFCFFAGGAVVGAFANHAWGVRAIWLPAGVLFVTLVMFVIDERKGIEP